MSPNFFRLKNQIIAKIITRFPALANAFIESYEPWKSLDIPWTPVKKALSECKVALVTTAGVHHADQDPYNMNDPDGDPSYRILSLSKPFSTLKITHDYYDHTDADRDMNVVAPLERLQEFEKDGIIGHLADINYGFMGHIVGRHIYTLLKWSAPEIAQKLRDDRVDVVLLTPA